ncbi:unnamed protein product [Parajaminaea phylloscopi]
MDSDGEPKQRIQQAFQKRVVEASESKADPSKEGEPVHKTVASTKGTTTTSGRGDTDSAMSTPAASDGEPPIKKESTAKGKRQQASEKDTAGSSRPATARKGASQPRKKAKTQEAEESSNEQGDPNVGEGTASRDEQDHQGTDGDQTPRATKPRARVSGSRDKAEEKQGVKPAKATTSTQRGNKAGKVSAGNVKVEAAQKKSRSTGSAGEQLPATPTKGKGVVWSLAEDKVILDAVVK